MLTCCLQDGTHAAWQGFGDWLTELLAASERAALAWSVLVSLDADDAEKVTEAVCRYAGLPLPRFGAAMDDARYWASRASRSERKAYALAGFEALNSSDQAAFLAHVCKRSEVAA